MSTPRGGAKPAKAEAESQRTLVLDRDARRPFMRGIMIHSLMSRGISYEDAYQSANAVRDQIHGREEVTRAELAQLLEGLLGDRLQAEPSTEGFSLPEEITVTGGGPRTPFSKGVLSQSLLAAAIDPQDAFDVARRIELELRARGTREVDRTDLRRLVCETLQKRSRRQAERYLVWRRFQEPEKPVILLLGGPPGAGKTSLGLEVAHRLGIQRVLSADAIRQIMRIMLSPELVPAVHASSYEAHRLIPGAALGEDPVLAGYMAQASAVSVGVRAMMDRAIAEHTSLVLDGVALLPGLIDVEAYADQAHVIFLVVAVVDTDGYARRFAKRAEGERMRPVHRYVEHLDAILRIQELFLEQADQYHVPIVDNDNFDESALSILRTVSETLRGKEPIDGEEWLS